MRYEDYPGTLVVGWVVDYGDEHQYACTACESTGALEGLIDDPVVVPILENEPFDHAIYCAWCDSEVPVRREDDEGDDDGD